MCIYALYCMYLYVHRVSGLSNKDPDAVRGMAQRAGKSGLPQCAGIETGFRLLELDCNDFALAGPLCSVS